MVIEQAYSWSMGKFLCLVQGFYKNSWIFKNKDTPQFLFCVRLGVEGLEDPDSAEDSSDGEAAESPGTSGSGTGSTTDHVIMTENIMKQWSASSEDSASCSSTSDAAEKSQECVEDSGKDLVEDPSTTDILANEKHKVAKSLKEGDQAYALSTQQIISQLQSTVSVINVFSLKERSFLLFELTGHLCQKSSFFGEVLLCQLT